MKNQTIKIAFLGTPEFSVPSLIALNDDPEILIEAVISQPDRPFGRKKELLPSPVTVKARELGFTVIQPENKKELEKSLQNRDLDFLVVLAYGMILPNSVLEIAKYGAINAHASLLPKYRGASPVHQALLNGDEETGISIMQITEKMDQGPVYLSVKCSTKNENLITLNEKLGQLTATVLAKSLKDIAAGKLKASKQDEEKASYCKKITKEDGQINWAQESATEIENKLKAFTPWPGIYCDFHGKKLKILALETSSEQISPGKFELKDQLKIGTKTGSIIPKIVQLEGKKETSIQEFINGNRQKLS